MTVSIVTITSFTTQPEADISVDSDIRLRGWYSNSFIAGDGSTPVEGGTGQTGFFYDIPCTLNGSNEVVVPAFDVQATTLSNPTANFTAQLYVDGSPSKVIIPNTQSSNGWQIPTVGGFVVTFAELALYNRAKRLLYPPNTYWTADQVITAIRQYAGNFDYAAVGINGITSMSFPPVLASLPIALSANDPRVGDWFNIEAYFASTTATAAQNAVFIAAANAAALAAGGGILIPIGSFVTNSVTISVPIQFVDGGILSAPSGQTITYTKSLTAGISQHFAGLGSHVFTGEKNLAVLYPQYWGIANDGTTIDTVPFQAFVDAVNNSHAVGYLTPKSQILLGTVTTVNTARGFSLTSGLSARNFNTNAPQLIWNGTGGTMFDFEQGQQVEIKGVYFKNASGKTIDTFIKFDGNPTSQIGTQGTVKYCSFDASNQLNASAKLISISPTASSNHENYYVGYCDFYGSSGIRATAVGKAIENGNSANAKHQRFEYLTNSNCAIGIDVLAGSADISHIGGGSNGIGIRIGSSTTEPTLIDHYEAEGDLQAVVAVGAPAPINCTNCRWSNANQTNAGGFLKFQGVTSLINCEFENTPPVGGTLIEDGSSGSMRLIILSTLFAGGTTKAQLGITSWALILGSTYYINPAALTGADATIMNSSSVLFSNEVVAGVLSPFEIRQTWPTGTADIQNGLVVNVTTGTSAAGSKLFDLIADSGSKFKVSKTGLIIQVEGGALTVSGNTIAPTTQIHQCGAGLIKNITVPTGFVSGTIQLIPTAAFTYDATGNILGTGTAVVGRTMFATFSSSTSKWSLSY